MKPTDIQQIEILKSALYISTQSSAHLPNIYSGDTIWTCPVGPIDLTCRSILSLNIPFS